MPKATRGLRKKGRELKVWLKKGELYFFEWWRQPNVFEKKEEAMECVRKKGENWKCEKQLEITENWRCVRKRERTESVLRKKWRQLNMDEKKEEGTEDVWEKRGDNWKGGKKEVGDWMWMRKKWRELNMWEKKERTECGWEKSGDDWKCSKKVETTERGLYVICCFLNAEGNRKCEKKEETMESVGKKKEATECVWEKRGDNWTCVRKKMRELNECEKKGGNPITYPGGNSLLPM